MSQILVPTSPGELIDKLTILELKKESIQDPQKLQNIELELVELSRVADHAIPQSDIITSLRNRLKQINHALWVIEDDIRICEKNKDFGDTFIQLARAVYITNDERAAVKKEINLSLGSQLIEEKSYQSY